MADEADHDIMITQFQVCNNKIDQENLINFFVKMDHYETVTVFQDITGQDADRSRFYLESSAWDVELALGSFYESDAMEVEDFEAARPQAEAPQPAAAAPPSRTPEEKPKADRAPTGASSRQSSSSSNINTFASR